MIVVGVAIASALALGQSMASVNGLAPQHTTAIKQAAGPPPPPPTLARPARPIDPGSWITPADYPVGAAATNQSGSVGFRVQVGTDGTVTECAVTQPSGWPLLDEMTCSLIALRARFTPATNAQGDRIRGSYANRIRWQLPQPQPAAPPATPPGG